MSSFNQSIIVGILCASIALAVGSTLPTLARQGEPAPKTEVRIAYVDVFGATLKLMETERFTSRMREASEKARAEIEPLEKKLDEAADRIRSMGPDARGPEAEDAARAFQRAQREIREVAARLDQETNRLAATINMEAYEQVVASADAIAEKKGYSHVFVQRTLDGVAAPDSMLAALQRQLARPVIRAPKGDDLTPDVLADLKLD